MGVSVESPSDCDVFISFSEEDQESAGDVAKILSKAGISYYYYPEHNLHPSSTNFLDGITLALSKAKVVVCMVSPHSVHSKWVEHELNFAINNGLNIVPLQIARFTLPRKFIFLVGFAIWKEIGNVREDDEYILERIKCEIEFYCGSPRFSQSAPREPSGKNPSAEPYVGPIPFDALRQDRFFGRDEDNRELLKCLQKVRLLLLHAPSGAGKSSLLNAKLAPELRLKDVQVFPNEGASGPLRVSHTGLESLLNDNNINIFTYCLMLGIAPNMQLDRSAKLGPYLRHSVFRPHSAKGRVIILDQFEEIFTHYPDRFLDRDSFIQDLATALDDDPSLRIVLSFRDEYLADVERLVEPVGDRVTVGKFDLPPMGPEGVRNAIERPVEEYLRFKPDALEVMINSLRQIRVRGPNGYEHRQGKFIEMAHLQVVCLRLWKSLNENDKVVTIDNLKEAAGREKEFGDFVVDALNEFYFDTVETVYKETGVPRDVIFFGCSRFVSTQGARLALHSQHGRTGRLSNKVVDRLVDHYLLRRESRGAENWYELSHDLLSEPVSSYRNRNPDVNAMLIATEMLDRALEKAALKKGHSLEDYFEEQNDLLHECGLLASHEGLFPEEQELLFRASIASGIDMLNWCGRIGNDFPELREKILCEALKSDLPKIRENAVWVICSQPVENLLDSAVDLAIADEDGLVRKTASLGLSRVDRPELYSTIAKFLDAGEVETREGTVETLSMIRMRSAGSRAATKFPDFFETLGSSQKRTIRRRTWSLRARDAQPLLIAVFILAAGFAGLTAGVFKTIPGYFNWGFCQHVAHPIIGLFQGAVAGMVWSGLISLGVTLYYNVFGNSKRKISPLRPFGALVFGALGGLVGGFVLTAVVTAVFNTDSLWKMGWITQGALSSNVFWQVFFKTRLGWVYLITGTGLGIGMALMTNGIRSSAGWKELLDAKTSHIKSFTDLWKMLLRILALSWPRFWLLCAALLVAALLAFFVPDTSMFTTDPRTKANPVALIKGLIGDFGTEAIGAFFGIAGMLLGEIIIRHGVSINPSSTEDE